MNNKQYKLAGWLSIAYAVLFVPSFILSALFEYITKYYPGVAILDIVQSTITLIIDVFLLLMLKKLLNVRYRFHETDHIILVLIGFNIFLRIIGFAKHVSIFLGITVSFESMPGDLIVFWVVLLATFFLLFGIAHIIFAIQILRLKDDLFGMLKPYAYATMTCGVFLASIVLSPLAMLVVVATFIIQGIIFLRSAEDVEFV